LRDVAASDMVCSLDSGLRMWTCECCPPCNGHRADHLGPRDKWLHHPAETGRRRHGPPRWVHPGAALRYRLFCWRQSWRPL